MKARETIRILLVDDHAMVRSGLKNFLYGFDGLQMVGEAANGAEAVAFCAAHDVDVVLMDMMMPKMDGCEATRQIMALGKAVQIVILTSFHEQDLVERALKAGARGYLQKNVGAEELAAAIRAAYAGKPTLSPEATEALIESTRNKPNDRYGLTQRETEVLAALAAGASNREISEQLSLSVATVKFHLSNIFSKLGAKNRLEAVTFALDHGILKHPG
jgi:NarL family two-component system response regulator LiaR